MGIVKQTLKRQIDSHNLQQMTATVATILKYYPETNTAGIAYETSTGDGKIYMDKVPISSSLGGLTSNNVKPGQSCTITFINFNPNAPLITGINNGNYKEKTNTDQGAFIIDEAVREQIDTTLETESMYLDWLDENNTWSDKYKNGTNYTNLDTTLEATTLKSKIDKFNDLEVGLTNLETKATLKMKSNGDIDIFVSDNVGIRISKTMRKIYLYGFDVSINGEMDLLAILKKCRDCEFEGYRNETEKENVKKEIDGYIEYIEGNIEELKKCIAYTKEITGDIQYFSSLDSAIGKFETMKRKYNEGKYNDSMEDLQDAYGQIMAYYEYFEEELIAARERWGLV